MRWIVNEWNKFGMFNNYITLNQLIVSLIAIIKKNRQVKWISCD